MAKQNNQLSTGAKAGIGAGIAAIAAAAGAFYFYGSKHSAQHRKQMKGWMIKAKGEVVEKLETMKDVSETAYDKAVTQVMDKYKKLKNIDPAEVTALAADLRRHWKNISSPAPKRKAIRAKKVK